MSASDNSLALLAETAAAWGLALSREQLAQFAAYTDELLRWNQQVNLTAIVEPQAIAVRHYLDSLRCALAWGAAPQSLVDIGSGAGFPGLPLKILAPALQLTLVESVGKKAAFLSHVVAVLGLTGVQVIPARVEELGRDPRHRERYDVAAVRAVAALRVLAEYSLPLVRMGGRLLAPKGGQVDAEVAEARRAIGLLGGELLAVEPVQLPGLEPRTLVVVGKIRPTPAAYPRGVGVPAHKPL